MNNLTHDELELIVEALDTLLVQSRENKPKYESIAALADKAVSAQAAAACA